MDDQNRVLIRRGARELNEEETLTVCGGVRTTTACTIAPRDGDTFLGEC
jgi:hypothetical protein